MLHLSKISCLYDKLHNPDKFLPFAAQLSQEFIRQYSKNKCRASASPLFEIFPRQGKENVKCAIWRHTVKLCAASARMRNISEGAQHQRGRAASARHIPSTSEDAKHQPVDGSQFAVVQLNLRHLKTYLNTKIYQMPLRKCQYRTICQM